MRRRLARGAGEKDGLSRLSPGPFIGIKHLPDFEHSAGQEDIARRIADPFARRVPKGVKQNPVAPPQVLRMRMVARQPSAETRCSGISLAALVEYKREHLGRHRGLRRAPRDFVKSTTSPLVPLSIADAMCLPTASLAAFTGSSAKCA